MPKVNEKYFESKKNKILEAAFSVCMKKPIYSVTMSDIISETGLSQGGVYKYFSNIDDIFIALTNKIQESHCLKDKIDEIFNSLLQPETILRNIFIFITENILSDLTRYGKISFELDTLYANNPKREVYYLSNVNFTSDFDYLIMQLYTYIGQKIEEGYFNPIVKPNSIFMFLIASYDGIHRDIILSKCYPAKGRISEDWIFDEKELMNTLYESIIHLLRPQGGENII